jgi:hypothetical protein
MHKLFEWARSIGWPRLLTFTSWIAAFIGGLVLLLTNLQTLITFVDNLVRAPDAHVDVKNVAVQMMKLSEYADIYIYDVKTFLQIPPDQRYYLVSFLVSKNPQLTLKNCEIIVDGDSTSPIASLTKIGDITKGTAMPIGSFRLRALVEEPAVRQMYMSCDDDIVSKSVNLYLPLGRLSEPHSVNP